MDFPQGGELKGLLEAARHIQSEVSRVRGELGEKTVEGESGAGMVKCQASAAGEVLALTIDAGLLTGLAGPEGVANRKMLEDLVVGAVNVALERAREVARDEMARVTGGLPFPPGAFGG